MFLGKQSKTFFGFYMNDDEALRLKLYCINQKSYYTQVIVDLINDFLDSEGCSTKQLVHDLAVKAQKEWEKLIAQNESKKTWKNPKSIAKKWDYFVSETRQSLQKRGIDSETVDLIIHELLELEVDR